MRPLSVALICAGCLVLIIAAQLVYRATRYTPLSGLCLVTGATGDVGTALVRQLHQRGIRCIVLGRNSEKLSELQKTCGAVPFSYDLGDFQFSDFSARLNELLRDNGLEVPPNAFFCAGSGYFGPLQEQDNIQQYFNANLNSAVVLAASYNFRAIALAGSCIAYHCNRHYASYHVCKAALNALARGLRMDYPDKRVCVVNPATVRGGGFFAQRGMQGAQTGLRALGKSRLFSVAPEEVARKMISGLEFGRATISVGWVSKALRILGAFE